MQNLSEFAINNIAALTYTALMIFGLLYAWYIFLKPTQRTWVSVVIGSGMVVVGSGIIIYSKTGSVELALTPLFCNIAAGSWQIIAQEIKQYHVGQVANSIKINLFNKKEGNS